MLVEQLKAQCGMGLATGLDADPARSLQCIADNILDVENEHCGCDECEGHDTMGSLIWNVVQFTDVVGPRERPSPGQKLAADIIAKKMGTVVATKPIVNAGNGNKFVIYLFYPNKKFITTYSE